MSPEWTGTYVSGTDPCLRNELLPMSPERTELKLAEREGFVPSATQSRDA